MGRLLGDCPGGPPGSPEHPHKREVEGDWWLWLRKATQEGCHTVGSGNAGQDGGMSRGSKRQGQASASSLGMVSCPKCFSVPPEHACGAQACAGVLGRPSDEDTSPK